jgi:hypothetical protein
VHVTWRNEDGNGECFDSIYRETFFGIGNEEQRTADWEIKLWIAFSNLTFRHSTIPKKDP